MSVIEALEDLLLAERNLIEKGRLSDLGRLEPLKSELLDRLSDAGQYSAEDLRRLQMSAEVNSGLLEAAGNGLKSALRQIEDVKQAIVPATYSRDGCRVALAQPSSQLRQKL